MIHKSRPIFSIQFHPEAKGGPLDSSYLFDAYLDSVNKYKHSQTQFQPGREKTVSPLLVDMLSKERVDVTPELGLRMRAEAAAAAATAAAATAA